MTLRDPLSFACALGLLVMTQSQPGGAQAGPNPLQLQPHHATAIVTDLDRAVRWYRDVFGFTLINQGERPDGARSAQLEIPGYQIGLVQDPGPPAPKPAKRTGWVHIVFTVPDPASTYAILKARGADVMTRGNVAPAAITTFLVHDSEGNEIEIVKR